MTSETPAPELETYPFEFTGRGGEFFRIWVVNVLLSILTLGIYSAWAKVRTTRYLYGNTRVAGDSFEYHAQPLSILKGRAIAVGLLIAYLLLSSYFPLVGTLLLLVLTFSAPWFIIRALRFRAQNSSWCNVRFNFNDETEGAFGVYVLLPMLGVITLGLAMPYVWYRQSQFTVDGHSLGKTPFRFFATVSQFYVIGAVIVLAIVGTFLLYVGLVGGYMLALDIDPEAIDPETLDMWIIDLGFYLGLGLFYVVLFGLYSGLRFRVLYNNLQLADNRITNSVGLGRFLFVSLTNGIAIVFTLGLFYPWAKMRMNSLLINAMTLHASNLEGFVSDQPQSTSALGDEMGEAFDLGMGL